MTPRADLHLVRLRLDAKKLYAFARSVRASAYHPDEGYAVHALLAALFDNGAEPPDRVAPKPFHIAASKERSIDVLGYASLDHVALTERARAFAEPAAWSACDIDTFASKPMPSRFAPGTRLGFAVRVCPVRRVARRGPMTKERAEVDAFVARAWEVKRDVVLDREEIYRDWLSAELTKEGAARLVRASMESFQIPKLLRRTHGETRKSHPTTRPDARFEGELEVTDPEAFATLLARGVGRHRAFGFGMLLLRPPKAPL